jgi:hypothetical protein
MQFPGPHPRAPAVVSWDGAQDLYLGRAGDLAASDLWVLLICPLEGKMVHPIPPFKQAWSLFYKYTNELLESQVALQVWAVRHQEPPGLTMPGASQGPVALRNVGVRCLLGSSGLWPLCPAAHGHKEMLMALQSL